MAFTIPEFPLLMDVYSMPLVAYDFDLRVIRLEDVPCQLRLWGSDPRPVDTRLYPDGNISGQTSVLVAAGTDLRDASTGGGPDLVELPVGSGRYYWLSHVDDVAKGFANEYRQATLIKVFTSGNILIVNFPFWPAPIP